MNCLLALTFALASIPYSYNTSNRIGSRIGVAFALTGATLGSNRLLSFDRRSGPFERMAERRSHRRR